MVKLRLGKRRAALVVIAVITACFLTVGLLIKLNVFRSNSTQVMTSAQIRDQANNLKAEALEAEADKNTSKELKLLKQAQASYEANNDTNNTIDMKAKIYLLEHGQ